ncbi:MAG: DnaA/Hda family protein, partial [Planctomycetota bacterium]|nr:DnaA/Hda family protein [Planctomycetota bacterium]
MSSSLDQRIVERFAQSVGRERYQRYFGRSARILCREGGLDVVAETAFVAEMIDKRFRKEITEAARETIGAEEIDVRFRVDPTGFERAGRTAPAEEEAVALAEPDAAGGAGRSSGGGAIRGGAWRGGRGWGGRRRPDGQTLRHRLEDFVVGEANELAHRAAERLAGKDCPVGFSPLFIHGGCGLGKTHLMQGIVTRFLELHPGAKVQYVTGEAFANAFITAVRSNRVD